MLNNEGFNDFEIFGFWGGKCKRLTGIKLKCGGSGVFLGGVWYDYSYDLVTLGVQKRAFCVFCVCFVFFVESKRLWHKGSQRWTQRLTKEISSIVISNIVYI